MVNRPLPVTLAAVHLTLLLAAAVPTRGAAQAPAGFRTVANKLSGVTFYYPTAYKQIPLKPTEKVLVAHYIRKKAPRQLAFLKRRFKGNEPMIRVFRYERRKPATGEKAPRPEEERKPKSLKEAMEAANKVYSFADFRRLRLGRLKVTPVKGDKGHYELTLKLRRPPRENDPRGYLVVRQVGEYDMGVYGFTLGPHYKVFTRTIKTMAKGLRITREIKAEAGERELDRIYKRKKVRGVEKRKALRRKLPKGWKAEDTPNFILLHHSPNTRLVSKFGRDVEAMRKVYAASYEAAGAIDAVGIVRVCRTKDEYHQYGGPRGSGGYWHRGTEELVLYDYSLTMRKMSRKEKRSLGRTLTNRDSMLVLYHECFHQYIFYALDRFAPHYWFNEGNADYFSGAVIGSGSKKVSRIGPAAWRIGRAIAQCKENKGYVPLKRLLFAERPEFYHPRLKSNYYAAAWSFIYFLKNAKEAAAEPRWASLLQDYYDALQKAGRKAKRAAKAAKMTLQEKEAAGVVIRRQVMERVLKGIDLGQLETAWRKWVAELRNPYK